MTSSGGYTDGGGGSGRGEVGGGAASMRGGGGVRVLAAVRKQNGVEKPTTKNASMAREVMACFVLVSKYFTVTHRTDTQIIGCAGTRGER